MRSPPLGSGRGLGRELEQPAHQGALGGLGRRLARPLGPAAASIASSPVAPSSIALRRMLAIPRARTARSRPGCPGRRARETEVEIDGRVVAALGEEPARRVGADVVDQLIESDELALALRHPRPLTAVDDTDELHDRRLVAVAGRPSAAIAARIRGT